MGDGCLLPVYGPAVLRHSISGLFETVTKLARATPFRDHQGLCLGSSEARKLENRARVKNTSLFRKPAWVQSTRYFPPSGSLTLSAIAGLTVQYVSVGGVEEAAPPIETPWRRVSRPMSAIPLN